MSETSDERTPHCHVHHVCIGHPAPSPYALRFFPCTCGPHAGIPERDAD